jgi:hypothetical protein
MGVKANSGNPAIELFAGVVSGLVVVRSMLSKQLASARSLPIFLRICSQRLGAALADSGISSASAAAQLVQNSIVDSVGIEC